MALEDLTGTKYIDSLNSSNPTATDARSEGDDHLRGIKNVLKLSFPGVTGAVTATHTELNRVDGTIPTVQENLQIYSGYVDSGATAEVVPSGWSVATSATGVYTVTHNLSLSTPASDLVISVQPMTTGVAIGTVLMWYVHTVLANSFVVNVTNSSGTATNSAFHFIAIKRV